SPITSGHSPPSSLPPPPSSSLNHSSDPDPPSVKTPSTTGNNCMRFFDKFTALFHHGPKAAPVPSSMVVNVKEDGKKVELVLERWTLACFGNELLPARQNLSIVFAPLPTLALYSLLYLTLAEKSRKRMRKICAVSEKSITSLGPSIASLLSSIETPSGLFFRVFVDRSQLDTVHETWTETAQSIFGPKVYGSL
ncbi:hypothetical protein PFISCL1PPCAC_9254, partial [Pristionchus fissidentatus]